MGTTTPRKTNKKPMMRPVEELKKKHAEKRSKKPPDAKPKKKHAAKRSKKPPDANPKKKLSEKNRFKKTVGTGQLNSNQNRFPSSLETNNTLSKVQRSTTRATDPFNDLHVVLSGIQPV